MKTKKKSDQQYVVELIGLDHVAMERLRASLRGSPFLFHPGSLPDAGPGDAGDEDTGDEPDLRVVSAELLAETSRAVSPVIACGPPGRLRSAYLAGCADYLRDPWTPEEFSLRAMAVLSRQAQRWQLPGGELSLERGSLVTEAGPVSLTYHELRILRLLLHSRGSPVSRDEMAYAVQGRAGRAASRSLDVHVATLRKKLRRAQPSGGRLIVSVRGQGYMIP